MDIWFCNSFQNFSVRWGGIEDKAEVSRVVQSVRMKMIEG